MGVHRSRSKRRCRSPTTSGRRPGKASALVEALSYIQRFQNKVVVVKVGGPILDDERTLTDLLTDLVFMNHVGMRPVLVHGGGKAINDAIHKAGLEPQMVQGRRYTDERTLAIAEHVLCNQINPVHRPLHPGPGVRGDGLAQPDGQRADG